MVTIQLLCALSVCWQSWTWSGRVPPSLVPRPLLDFISPDFSPQLQDKIWGWPGDRAVSPSLYLSQPVQTRRMTFVALLSSSCWPTVLRCLSRMWPGRRRVTWLGRPNSSSLLNCWSPRWCWYVLPGLIPRPPPRGHGNGTVMVVVWE